MHDELIVKELGDEVTYNHKGCIVFDSIVYLPFENICDSNFQFSFGIDGYPFMDCKLNHRYPNKEYYTISRKYGRRLSKIGYPYFLDLQDGKQKLLISIHYSLLDTLINIKFPIEINLTEMNPVCGLGIRYIHENGELILTSNERTDDGSWMTYRWRGIMNENGDKRMETGINYAKMMKNPTFNKDTKTWSFEEIIKLAPQKLEDLFLLA